MSRRFWSLTLAAAALAVPARATPIEDLSLLVVHPTDPSVMALKVANGQSLVVTKDGGTTWSLLCEAAILPGNESISALGMAADGKLQLGIFGALYADDGQRCVWGKDPALDGRWPVDLTLHPSDPEVLFAVTADGGEKLNGILRRDADGAWSKVGTEEMLRISRLRVTTVGAALRFYQSAARDLTLADGGFDTGYVIRVSDDEGTTWREHPFETDASLRLLAVDPSNPDRIVVHLSRFEAGTLEESADDLLVSSDQGATFAHYLTVTELGAFAFGKDGRVFIGDRGSIMFGDAPKGLWTAPNLDTAPTSLATEYPVLCLGYQPASDTLYGCQRWWFGTIDPASGAFTTTFRLQDTPEMVSCEGMDMAATCELQLCRGFCKTGHFALAAACGAYDSETCGPCAENPAAATCMRPPIDVTPPDGGVSGGLDGGGPGGGGTGGGGAAPDAGPSPPGSGGCSCATAGAQGRAPWSLAGLTLAVILATRRARRR